eukprot:ANDGO_02248.mRNA.1 hypothetical protein H257_15268
MVDSGGGSAAKPKLSYAIHFVTSEDKDGPATELHRRTVDSRGWHSDKFCDFPQEVVISFEGEVAVDAIQILGHEFKIPTRIEIYLYRPQFDEKSRDLIDVDAIVKPEVHKLGYISMDKNDQSGHKARELKTVQLSSERAVALKLVLQRCHINPLNLYNQVALMGISVFGTVVTPFPVKTRSYTSTLNESLDLSQMRPMRKVGMTQGDTANDQFDAKTLERIREYTYLKEKAVSEEDYDTASRLKSAIDRLRVVGSKIADLETRKLRAVASEDYELAKRIKEEIEDIRRTAEEPTSKPVRRRLKRQNPFPEDGGRMHGEHQQSTEPMQTHHQGANEQGRDRTRNGSLSSSSAAPPASVPETAMTSTQKSHQEVEDERSSLFGGAPQSTRSKPPLGASDKEDELRSSTVMSARGESPDKVMANNGGYLNMHDEKPVRALAGPSFSDAGNIDDTPVVSSNGVPFERKSKSNKNELSSSTASVPFSQILAELPDWEQDVVKKMKGFQADLPVAEEAAANDVLYNGIKNVLGSYVSRCLVSPGSWQLRECALRAVEACLGGIPGAASSRLKALDKVCTKAMSDKMAQVTLSAVHATSIGLATLGKDCDKVDLDIFVSSFLHQCVERLGDSNARLRDACSTALVDLVDLPYIGAKPVLSALIHPTLPTNAKQAKALQANWRFLGTRLTTLVSVFQNFGHLVRKEGALGKDLVQLIVKDGLNHANGQVRQSSIQTLAEVYRIFGPHLIESHLEALRPVQVDEIRRAFAEIDSVDGADRDFPEFPAEQHHAAHDKNAPVAWSGSGKGPAKKQPSPGKSRKPEEPSNDKHPKPPLKKDSSKSSGNTAAAAKPAGQSPARKSGGKSSDGAVAAADSPRRKPVSKKVAPPPVDVQDDDEVHNPALSPDVRQSDGDFAVHSGGDASIRDSEEWKVPEDDPQTCQFCGQHSPDFTDETIDLHYWQDCPMLTVCQSCGQVVELASLNEHLLHECELKDDFAQCRKCEFAIQVDQLAKHQKSCSFPNAAAACPLCREPLPNGEWPWQRHFLSKTRPCKQNPRTMQDSAS